MTDAPSMCHVLYATVFPDADANADDAATARTGAVLRQVVSTPSV